MAFKQLNGVPASGKLPRGHHPVYAPTHDRYLHGVSKLGVYGAVPKTFMPKTFCCGL